MRGWGLADSESVASCGRRGALLRAPRGAVTLGQQLEEGLRIEGFGAEHPAPTLDG